MTCKGKTPKFIVTFSMDELYRDEKTHLYISTGSLPKSYELILQESHKCIKVRNGTVFW